MATTTTIPGVGAFTDQTQQWMQAPATATGAMPGKDVYSQALQQMMTGQFAPQDPSYQWRLQQGEQALERSLAASGLLQSGNAGIALEQYGQGMASTEYQAQFQRLLQASGLVVNQYDAVAGQLARMAGLNMQQRPAVSSMGMGGGGGSWGGGISAAYPQSTSTDSSYSQLWDLMNMNNTDTQTQTIDPLQAISQGYYGFPVGSTGDMGSISITPSDISQGNFDYAGA